MRKIGWFGPLAVLVLAAPLWGGPAVPLPDRDTLLDMSYPFDESSLYWPTARRWETARVAWGVSAGGWWYAANDFQASEHGGTHVDAPIHFAANGRTIDQIPLHEWVGPAVKIDVADRCADRDYRLQVADILAWEQTHGRIPDRAWVLMYTGLGTRHYPDPGQVLGTDRRGPDALPSLRFPGFSAEAATFLVEQRSITGIGIDTPSIDAGQAQDFPVHQVICGADKLAIENIANLDRLPEHGAVLYAMPISIRSGTGAPARVFAVLPKPTPGER